MKNLLSLTISTVFIVVLITATGCKKDEGNGADKKVLLTSHIWKFNDLSSTSANSDVQMAVGVLKALMTNATVNFSTNGGYTMIILGQSGSGTWEFKSGETSIIMDKGTADEYEEFIVQLTSNILELKENIVDVDLGSYSITYKWIK